MGHSNCRNEFLGLIGMCYSLHDLNTKSGDDSPSHSTLAKAFRSLSLLPRVCVRESYNTKLVIRKLKADHNFTQFCLITRIE